METHKLYICNKIIKQVNCPGSVCILCLFTLTVVYGCGIGICGIEIGLTVLACLFVCNAWRKFQHLKCGSFVSWRAKG